MADIKDKWTLLENNIDFIQSVIMAKNAGEVVKLFSEKDIKVSVENAQSMLNDFAGELTEDELEDVAGGTLLSKATSVAKFSGIISKYLK